MSPQTQPNSKQQFTIAKLGGQKRRSAPSADKENGETPDAKYQTQLPRQPCKGGGCKKYDSSMVVDSNWRWAHTEEKESHPGAKTDDSDSNGNANGFANKLQVIPLAMPMALQTSLLSTLERFHKTPETANESAVEWEEHSWDRRSPNP